MRRQSVEHCHSATVSARRVRCNNAIPSLPAGVYAVSDFCFLEDTQVHVGLGHPPQRRLQSPVTTVMNIIGAKPNRHLPPCRLPSTPTHPRPTDSCFTPAPTSLPAYARFPFSRSRPRSAPADLPLPFPSPFPSLFSTLSYSVTFTLA